MIKERSTLCSEESRLEYGFLYLNIKFTTSRMLLRLRNSLHKCLSVIPLTFFFLHNLDRNKMGSMERDGLLLPKSRQLFILKTPT